MIRICKITGKTNPPFTNNMTATESPQRHSILIEVRLIQKRWFTIRQRQGMEEIIPEVTITITTLLQSPTNNNRMLRIPSE